jgi:hypothetical protein
MMFSADLNEQSSFGEFGKYRQFEVLQSACALNSLCILGKYAQSFISPCFVKYAQFHPQQKCTGLFCKNSQK